MNNLIMYFSRLHKRMFIEHLTIDDAKAFLPGHDIGLKEGILT